MTIRYPIPPLHTGAEPVDVAPGVKWLRLPMPYALDHVNVYLVRTESGWIIVDTGLDSPAVRGIWDEVFAGPLQGEKIAGVCCTHYHVDHVGLAGYLAERWRVPLYMSYRDYFTLRGWPMDLKEVPWQHARFFHRIGLPQDLLQQTLLMFEFSANISPLPPSFVRLEDGAGLRITGGEWQVLTGAGHAPEHVMLYSGRHRVLISGDQLLPRISSNISVSAVDPEDEPLSRWFRSMGRLARLPKDILVLPGHGLPFRGARTRLRELRKDHERKFGIIMEACTTRPLSVFDVVQTMYPATLPPFDLQLALGECLAHVRHLVVSGRLQSSLDDAGVERYRCS